MIDALNARRTAILAGVLALTQVLQTAIRADQVTVLTVLGAAAASVVAYTAAYTAIGLLEKQIVTVVAGALAGVITGIQTGLSLVDIAVGVLITILIGLGAQAALPSTRGSVPMHASLFDRHTVVGEVVDGSSDVVEFSSQPTRGGR